MNSVQRRSWSDDGCEQSDGENLIVGVVEKSLSASSWLRQPQSCDVAPGQPTHQLTNYSHHLVHIKLSGKFIHESVTTLISEKLEN